MLMIFNSFCNVISLYFVHWSPLKSSGLWFIESNSRHWSVGVKIKETQYFDLVHCEAQLLREITPSILLTTETLLLMLTLSNLKNVWVIILAFPLMDVIPIAVMLSETNHMYLLKTSVKPYWSYMVSGISILKPNYKQ